MTKDELATYLEGLAAGIPISGDPGLVTAELVAKGLLSLGAMLARQGLHPVEHITRLVDLDASMDAAAKEAEAGADKKWPSSP